MVVIPVVIVILVVVVIPVMLLPSVSRIGRATVWDASHDSTNKEENQESVFEAGGHISILSVRVLLFNQTPGHRLGRTRGACSPPSKAR